MLRPVIGVFGALLLLGCGAEADASQDASKAQSTAEPVSEPALELTGRVVDAANIFSPEFEADITKKLAQFEADTQAQFVVVTTLSLYGRAIDSYSLDLANSWGAGPAERDDRLMILIAPNERQARIEVGLGMKTTVTGADAELIMERDMLPQFKTGDFESGAEAGVDGVMREVMADQMRAAA
jgi:uncharacterized protein